MAIVPIIIAPIRILVRLVLLAAAGRGVMYAHGHQ